MTADGVSCPPLSGQSLHFSTYINSHNNNYNNNYKDSLGRFPKNPDHRLVEEDGDDGRDDEEGHQLVDGDCTASPGMTVSRRVLGALEDLH